MREIELTPTSFIVLGLLDAAGEATPYELKQAAAQRLGRFWSLAHSQLYAEPVRLARAGYLAERNEQTGRRRRHYRLSARGRRALRAWLAEPRTTGYELRDPGLLKLALGADPAALAAAQRGLHESAMQAFQAQAEELAGTLDENDVRLLTLQAGVGHEREYVRFWTLVAERSRGDQPADNA